MTDPKATLLHYLQRERDALVWKLDGLSEYDVRRPMTPSGTNLLGLVKHVASVEAGYLGETFGRPLPIPIPWFEEGVDAGADMYASADESRDYIVDFYRQVWTHSDETVAALELDAVGNVPWWPAERNEVTLHQILVHMINEAARHAGHADIVREMVDGAIGLSATNSNAPEVDDPVWGPYLERLEAIAQRFA